MYKLNDDGITLGDKLTYVSGTTPASGKYVQDGSALTFLPADVAVGDKIVVWYDRTVTGATRVSNLGDKVAKDVHMVIDVLAEDKACNVYYGQLDIPKAALKGTFDLGYSGSQTMQNIEWEALAVACSGSTAKFWDLLIVDDDVIESV